MLTEEFSLVEMLAIHVWIHCLILSISEVMYATLLYNVWYLLANNSAILLDSDTPLTVVEAPADLPVIFRTSAPKS